MGVQVAPGSRTGRDTVRVAVVGSSFIGMEAAASLIKTKQVSDVVVIGMEEVRRFCLCLPSPRLFPCVQLCDGQQAVVVSSFFLLGRVCRAVLCRCHVRYFFAPCAYRC